jgi:hypothetical protein
MGGLLDGRATLSKGISPDCAKLNSRYVYEPIKYRPVRRDKEILAGKQGWAGRYF